MSFLSGTEGSVLIGATPYKFAKWRATMQNGLPRVNNFSSAYQQLVLGLTKAQISLEGPYDSAAMPFTVGSSYSFVLKWTASLSLTITARVAELTPDNNVEDAPRLSVTADSDGSFAASVT